MRKVAILGLMTLIMAGSCRRNDLFSGRAELVFSTDTVLFDTVFTTIGTITERVKVFNPYAETVEISRIFLERGSGSNFKLNADGTAGKEVLNLQIAPFDSIFIFIEATIDPNGGNTPMVVEEKLFIETENNLQFVHLVAWGQDAYFYPGISFGDLNGDGFGDQWVLPTDKPVVFYGYSIVDTGAVLTIPCGAQIHFHSNSGLVVGHEASLKVLGCLNDPVVMQGDRLESFFDDIAGQWGERFGGIYLTQTSVDNEIRNAIIKNGTVGVIVDSNTNANPTLILENTQILNMSLFGILGQDARIEATNTVVANCGDHAVALRFGGDYHFKHCTFANYWTANPRSKATLLLNNAFEVDGRTFVRDFKARFENTIVYGALDEEIEIQETEGQPFEYFFDHCVLKRDTNELNDPTHYAGLILNPSAPFVDGVTFNPLFADVNTDFKLNAFTRAIDAGKQIGVIDDLEGNIRDGSPDIGAYEYQPE